MDLVEGDVLLLGRRVHLHRDGDQPETDRALPDTAHMNPLPRIRGGYKVGVTPPTCRSAGFLCCHLGDGTLETLPVTVPACDGPTWRAGARGVAGVHRDQQESMITRDHGPTPRRARK